MCHAYGAACYDNESRTDGTIFSTMSEFHSLLANLVWWHLLCHMFFLVLLIALSYYNRGLPVTVQAALLVTH